MYLYDALNYLADSLAIGGYLRDNHDSAAIRFRPTDFW
jgi:hypothetical protein